MVKEIFSKIIEAIDDKILDKEIGLDKNGFIEIKKRQGDKKIAFVDGGNAELLKAVNFSLQLVRTAALIFQNNKKVESIVNEFFVLAYADGDEYKTELFPLKGETIAGIVINSFDATIREGNERASVSKVGGIIRRFAELKLAEKAAGKADVVVLDGSLKCMVKGEEEYMQGLLNKATTSGIIVASLAKTSKILSKDGGCIASQLDKLAGTRERWYYELEQGVGIAKFNKSSNHVFEFNIKQNEKATEVLSLLAVNSNDAVFPGYPYGLLQVDKAARVTNDERDYWLTMFKANAGKRWHELKANVNVFNAHEILDNI